MGDVECSEVVGGKLIDIRGSKLVLAICHLSPSFWK